MFQAATVKEIKLRASLLTIKRCAYPKVHDFCVLALQGLLEAANIVADFAALPVIILYSRVVLFVRVL